MISEGFEGVLSVNPCINRLFVFRKKAARYIPWIFPRFVRDIRHERYDLAIDVSDGHHVSFNNTLLTALSGARYRMGYDREGAGDFLNVIVPRPPDNVHMADAMIGLARYLDTSVPDYPMTFYVTDSDRASMSAWLRDRNIGEMDSFFVIHAGGRGRKQWGIDMFAELIGMIESRIGVKIVLIGGPSEHDIISDIRKRADIPFEVLSGVTVGEMAAVIERCDMFISNDTGPMHVSSALGKPTVGIFHTSNYRVYGPRGPNGRIVAASSGKPSVEDVMMAVMDIIEGRMT
jgi:ADP-heptose:LPS heptosyltransferase